MKRLPLLLLCLVLLTGCSTKKNTSGSRFWHSFTARFNTYHNGSEAYKEGMIAKETGNKDNYTEMLPFFMVENTKSAQLGASNFETAITKCEKAIHLHSIKKKPVLSANKTRSPKTKAYLQRKEFNPFLKHAWLLMGRAQYQKGDFIAAASTFSYITRLYAAEPIVANEARLWMARSYTAMDWYYDAEDALGRALRDTIPSSLRQTLNDTQADLFLSQGKYEEAVPLLQKAAKAERRKLPKARLYFLLGQVHRELGHKREAYKALRKCLKQNPPYELAFNARILQTEVLADAKTARKMVSRLQRMARSNNNKDYLDQVYYAMGNIYLGVQDTARCLSAWEKGVEEATKSGPSKAMLLLRLSQMYWEKEDYINAARTYKGCVGILDKEHDEYKEAERRSKILSELEPHLSTIKLQDSLQALAKMSEPEYTAAIDRVIEALKKKEKEEEKKAARNGTATNNNASAGNNTAAGAQRPQQNTGMNAGTGQKGAWYFYNPNMVKQGEQEFRKRWGQRPNEDYWRISNRQMLPGAENQEETSISEAQADSLYGAGGEDNLDEDEQARKDSLANDPHHREYYLKQIPFTEEQMAESNSLLAEGLYHAGILEQERLENFPLAEKTMLRLLNDFPEQEGLDDIYYHLFLLYGRIGNPEEAEQYRRRLLEEYPESKLAALLGSPYYEMIAKNGKHMEDSVYAQAYQAYTTGDYAQVEKNYLFSTENFPQGIHRARMLFIRAMANLYGGERDTFLVSLKEVVQKYPKEEVTQLANAIVKGLDEGRQLMSEQYDASSIWARRTRKEGADSTDTAKQLSEERYTNFVFILAYPSASLDEDLLLYEMAHYNFTSYMVRNFDLEITEDRGLRMMTIKGFLSYDEAHAYAQKLYADKQMSTLLKGIRSLIISEENLKLIGTEYSFEDYKEFYETHFAPMQVPEDLQIDEPTDLKIIDPDDVIEEEEEEGEETEDAGYDDFPYGF